MSEDRETKAGGVNSSQRADYLEVQGGSGSRCGSEARSDGDWCEHSAPIHSGSGVDDWSFVPWEVQREQGILCLGGSVTHLIPIVDSTLSPWSERREAGS